MNKTELRRYFKESRKAFVLSLNYAEVKDLLGSIKAHLERTLTIPANIAGYDAMTSELDPKPILEAWESAGSTIALPFFSTRSDAMVFRKWDGRIESGPFGISQPPMENPIIEPDMLLVPLVAVDRAGNRLGHGQGHYDRALAALRKKKTILAVGMAWECQIAQNLPADPWDQPLDYVVTPDRLIETHQ